MSSHEDDDDSTIPLEFVVLSGLQRAIGWFFAFVLAFVTWAIVTVWLTYVALTAPDGSFLQSLASELSATICRSDWRPYFSTTGESRRGRYWSPRSPELSLSWLLHGFSTTRHSPSSWTLVAGLLFSSCSTTGYTGHGPAR